MLINDASKVTGLTKKAIGYYVEHGLVSPAILVNGYRDFGEGDICALKKIMVLRKLGISIQDIRAVFADKSGGVLSSLSVQQEAFEKSVRFLDNIPTLDLSSGYYDVFIPLVKQLSPAYARYCAQMEGGDRMLLEQYPEMTE